jgi:uncharacterized protein (DUF427 family)
MKAYWNNQLIAESSNTEEVEGNHYFPADSLKKEFFKESDTQTTCGWKGQANYFTLEVNGSSNPDAAWYYPETKPLANKIKGHVAFWRGVEIKES